MVVGVPGAYRGLSWRPRYTPELVAALLPTVWGYGIAGQVEARANRCNQGASKCTHTCDADQWVEGCVVDGEHRVCVHRHGGHSQCGRCVCVDPAGRQGSDNRESDVAVMIVDIKTAWARNPLSSQMADALYCRYALDMTEQSIADLFNVSRMAISLRLKAGHGQLADFLNRGWVANERT